MPEALETLPVPTHAFIGGGTAQLEEILEILFEKNPRVRVVINVIALESLNRVTSVINAKGLEAEIVSVMVARAQNYGGLHLMKGEDVYKRQLPRRAGASGGS